MPRWLPALALAAVPLAGAAEDVPALLDSCIARLDHALDIGYGHVAAACPQLTATLAHSEWAPWLPRDWSRADNELSAEGLAELRTLLRRAADAPAGVHTPHTDTVAALLARITEPDRPRSWWVRFCEWLREIFARQPRPGDDSWLRRLFGDLDLSQAVVEGIAWICLALVVALAAAVVVNELRVAGVLKSRRPRPAPGAAPARSAAGTLDEITQAPPAQQPQLLLELLTARLGEQRRLPPARALTVHELTRAARLPQEADREHLRALAAVCECVRFSNTAAAPTLLAAALAHGRELLAAIETAPALARGARLGACASD
jgi:hypothetical protein